MSKKTICIFTSIEGHFTLAKALEQLLENTYDVHIYFERDNSFTLYLPIYQLFPGAFKYPFQISQKEKVVNVIHQYAKSKYQKKIAAFCKKYQPDLCINTFWMYNRCLEEVCGASNIPFINVLTDPRTVHPAVIAEKATANVLFDEGQKKFCQKFFPNANYVMCGWLVKEEYELPYDQAEVRKNLGLKKDALTILLTSGSEGTNIITKILPAMMTSDTPLQIIVACGSNKTLLRAIKTLSTLVKATNSHHTIFAIPFTHQLYFYMQASDLVMGKAGPNTIFESVATQTPFFAITHIAGQEDGNLDILREYHLGYVEENTFKAAKILKKIM